MANRKITCEPHPLSGATEGPVLMIPDDQMVDLTETTQKAAVDVVAGDMILLYRGGPQFEVIDNVEEAEVTS